MKNQELVDLNFRRLIDYRGQPPVRREHPIECFGYCTSCEDEKIIDHGILAQMSHGCDTEDFEALLHGPFSGVKRFDEPVMFLLEDPGGDHDLGPPFPYQGHCKAPPVNCYYFAPEREALPHWPSRIDDFNFRKYYYGPYFAYLMQKHGLANVYITNTVKCGLPPAQRHLKSEPQYLDGVRRNCVRRFLTKELDILRPSLVLSFGKRAQQGFTDCVPSSSLWKARRLWHPAVTKHGRKPEDLVKRNDESIRQALEELEAERGGTVA